MYTGLHKKILQKILAGLARLMLARHHPKIIGVTGSIGKTSTKEAIFTVLKKNFRVRKSAKSFNTEIGLPLTILGGKNHYNDVWGWLIETVKSIFKVFFSHSYPEILILELGVQKPQDMDYLLKMVRPFIGVITALGDIPVHVEFFSGPRELAEEKAKLIEVLPKEGMAILNYDDAAVYEIKNKTKARILSFGFHEHSDLVVTNYELRIKRDSEGRGIPDGINFKIEYAGNTVPIRLRHAFGKPHAYAAAAAAAVGAALGLNLVEISSALEEYEPPPGRMRLLEGIKHSWLLDDTYNASPYATHSALDTLKDLPAKRRIAILGDMLELGRFSEQAHRAVGLQAGKLCNIVVAVGEHARFIAEEAKVLKETYFFPTAEEATRWLDPFIKEGDLILIKGSQGMRMEKVVEEIMAHPEQAQLLLVRQDEFWKKS